MQEPCGEDGNRRDWFLPAVELRKGRQRNKESKDSITVPYRKKREDPSLDLALKIHLTYPKWAMLTLLQMTEAYPLL